MRTHIQVPRQHAVAAMAPLSSTLRQACSAQCTVPQAPGIFTFPRPLEEVHRSEPHFIQRYLHYCAHQTYPEPAQLIHICEAGVLLQGCERHVPTWENIAPVQSPAKLKLHELNRISYTYILIKARPQQVLASRSYNPSITISQRYLKSCGNDRPYTAGTHTSSRPCPRRPS